MCSKKLPAADNLKIECVGCGKEAHTRCCAEGKTEEFTCTNCKEAEEANPPSLADVMSLLNSMNAKLTSVQKTLEKQKGAIDSLVNDVRLLKEENVTLKKELEEVKQQQNESDQYNRRATLEIQGVPEKNGENVSTIVTEIGNALGMNINNENIDACHRLGKKSGERPRTIIVKFLRRQDQEKMIKERKMRRMLNVDDVWKKGFTPSENSTIYINESLTPSNRKLHAEARKIKKDKNYKYLWVKGGNIYIRKQENSQRIHIKTMSDILNL